MKFSVKPEQTYGLVVGIEKYQENSWNVDGQVNDALKFAQWLSGRGVPRDNIRLCLSPLEENGTLAESTEWVIEEATESNITTLITDVLSEKKGDLLYLFWAGHGLITSTRNRRLLFADATKRNWQNLDLDSLLVYLSSDSFKISHHICIIDACANYILESQGRPTNLGGKTFPSGKPKTESQQFVLLATREGERAKVSDQEKTGYFSQAVREALEEESNGSFPPDMEVITEKVKQRFKALFKALDKKQLPTYLYRRNWDGDTDIYHPNQLSPQIPHNLDRSGVIKFVGRDETLQQLHQQLQQTERIAICAVAGMGGVGKTELALQYAQHHRKQGTYPGGLCWIKAGAFVGTEIVSFARTQLDLQLPDGLKLAEQIDYCWRHWRSGDVLFVFDDVRDYRQVKSYLPPAESRFKVLITTRRQGLGASFEMIPLNVLSEAAAIALLVSLIGEERIEAEPETAKQLCQELGYLPLGLELVGRYLQRKLDLSLEKMCQRLGLKHRSLQNPDEDDGDMTAQLGVEAAFELSWQELSEKAQVLGCFLSLFALAPIPWVWVERCWEDQDVEELEDARDYELLNLSLLERADKGSYQLHQLIREFLKEKFKELTETDELKQRFCQGMVAAAQQIPGTPTKDDIVIATPMIPHLAEAATTQPDWLSDEDLMWFFVCLGRFYEGQGLYKQALPWRKQCLSAMRERLEENHPLVANSLDNLALLYSSQGRYLEAEPLHLQALELNKRLLGDDHLSVAASLNNLALLYSLWERYGKAEPLCLRALELSKRLRGDDHLSVATSLNNLAYLYKSQERYGEAEPLYQKALELIKRLLGDDHPDVATSMNNLANLYESQGKYYKAEPLYLQTLELRKRLLGDDHSEVATSLGNLALLYKSQKRYLEAESLYLQALDLKKRRLGDDHPDVATILNNLALLYNLQGRYDEAEPFYLEALELYKRLLGDNHPHVATSLNNLAHISYSQGRYDKAEPLFQQALELRKRLLGDNHPDVATSLNNLAGLYYLQGRYDKAEPLFQQALELRKRLLSDNHPDVASSLNNLAGLYLSQGRYGEAEPLYLQALELSKRLLGDEHPLTITICENLQFLREERNQ
ncbi:MAG: tetratricopeptide repeat protein [Coleofasciculus sp. G3-WIS-01]|uniref:tetratricopeptide repeat protein n=1 Tax=Coleofasciculus sp. G3-WIS-01 TaxID=3069528 RepID=UPI0032F62DF8